MPIIQTAFFLLILLRLSASVYSFYQINQANKLLQSSTKYDLIKLKHVAQQTQNKELKSKLKNIERAEIVAKATLGLLLLTVVAWIFLL
ncbi:MAG: hypothetical protein LPJ89_11140 [Hymenobacteraceae bacterium]|mgnify:CR=1 FL=1|nr:hypothetical protein [Hymenobacteraceae bacterium]MDX5397932.1 hypothetical protein [Hymenobacteraceae bacterium]MDX5444323.1 hypothetical protein [Hymenobacteraceae bacterium]MDX5514001.1 hypothetical protein [Hymenobacteraceae bacterium]